MGYSGLIYAAIVAAWAAFLVPRWVRRNEEVERAREADAERGVRVLERRSGPRFAPHRTVAVDDPTHLHGGANGSIGASVTENERGVPASRHGREPDALGEAFAEAARRRLRILAILLLAFVVTVVGSLAGGFPGWAPVAVGLLTGGFLVMARRAAVTQAHRRRRQATYVRAVGGDEGERFDEEPSADDADVSEPAPRRLVLPDSGREAEGTDEWEPVPVPLPTYVTKPQAPQVERTIDLSRPGSWTSGRLDPVGSVELPRRDPDQRPSTSTPAAEPTAPGAPSQTDVDADELPEHRRAVGD